jgi:ubiquinone/menaquinone biosynthesis C-methylase UbiE
VTHGAPDRTDADEILDSYDRRAKSPGHDRYWLDRPGNAFALDQLERMFHEGRVRRGIQGLGELDILEVGCGDGGQIGRLVANGADPRRTSGIDLREDAIAEAHLRIPDANLVVGDASNLPYADGSFDLVYQATALSSMPSPKMRARVAAEMMRVVRPGGLIVSYDFAWNPVNRDTVGIGAGELRRLFRGMPIEVHRLTLLPPLARWLGDRSERALRLATRIGPLKTHRLAFIDAPR